MLGLSFAKKVVFAGAALLGCLHGDQANAIYATDRGKNEWHVETLGELSDTILFAAGQAYTLSTDGLLTLFDTNNQKIEWKKQLPQGQHEEYRLRHFRRNLVAHSDERVAMFNSAGHVIFEQPVDGAGPSVLEMFHIGDGIFTVVVRGDIVTVFKQYLNVGSFRIEEGLSDLPAAFTGVFEPLQLIYNGDKLMLTAKVGTNEDNYTLCC